MKLYAVDAALLRGNLMLDHPQPLLSKEGSSSAQEQYELAKKLIDETGYHLRNKELEQLNAKI